MRSAHIQRKIYFEFWGSEKSAELVGAKPLHLLAQTALPLKSPTGAFIAAQTRTFQNPFFTEENHKDTPGQHAELSGGVVL
ncbi:hypothetical protein C7K05_07040 [Faecalibacterium prausnitzii]|uniref:Uncharacterized protein n=1 Tax=Faecalibacterium prausnitzii TaxID=853 RepID=A0A367G6Q3_9FIRM|nr:hypothetical protein C7J97_07840 [Faecalibacterium prausnitzii]RCH50383.1 hypothetical protein C7K05_07040 [Faecalibacterium prausnitzii]